MRMFFIFIGNLFDSHLRQLQIFFVVGNLDLRLVVSF